MAEDTHGMGIPLPADSTPIHKYPSVARSMGERIAQILAGGTTEAMDRLATAVLTDAISSLDLVTGEDERLPRFGSSAEHLAVLLDQNRNETWIGARAEDGGPTDWAMHLLGQRLGLAPAANSEYLFALADKDRNLTDLTVRATDGQLADFVIDRLRERILGGASLPAGGSRQYADIPYAPGSGIYPVHADSRRAAGWGSSSMAGIEWRIKGFLERTTPKTEYLAGGRGGEIAEQTAARIGSAPALLTVTGGSVPASGSVTVTASNVPLTSHLRTYAGTLAGIPGNLSYQASPAAYLFTRTRAGSVQQIPADTPFVPDAVTHQDATVFLWMGKNNLGQRKAEETVIRLTDQAFDWLAPLHKQALVLGHFADSNTPADSLERQQLLAVNAAHRKRYGRLFIDVYAYVTGSQVWADTGITPTAADLAAQAMGNKPPSLSADAGHLNDAGYIAVTNLITSRLTELGWY